MANSIEFQRLLLGEVLNYWLELAGVRPRLDWSTAKPAVQLGGYGSIGALAVQLLFDCSRTMDSRCVRRVGRRFCPGHGGRGETAISTVRTVASRRRRAMQRRATGRRRSTVLHTTRGCRSGAGPQHSSSVSPFEMTFSSSPAIVVVAGPN